MQAALSAAGFLALFVCLSQAQAYTHGELGNPNRNVSPSTAAHAQSPGQSQGCSHGGVTER